MADETQLLTKREVAEAVLDEVFEGTNRVTIHAAVSRGAERGVSKATLYRVAAARGVKVLRQGRHGGLWERGDAE
jgi:hypothetical protein